MTCAHVSEGASKSQWGRARTSDGHMGRTLKINKHSRTRVELGLALVGFLNQDICGRALNKPAELTRDVVHHHTQTIMQVLALSERNFLARAMQLRG